MFWVVYSTAWMRERSERCPRTPSRGKDNKCLIVCALLCMSVILTKVLKKYCSHHLGSTRFKMALISNIVNNRFVLNGKLFCNQSKLEKSGTQLHNLTNFEIV